MGSRKKESESIPSTPLTTVNLNIPSLPYLTLPLSNPKGYCNIVRGGYRLVSFFNRSAVQTSIS